MAPSAAGRLAHMPSANHVNQIVAAINFPANSSILIIGFLTLLTGLLILARPNVIYYLVAGYLLIIGVISFTLGASTSFVATAIITGLLILIFPKLIPYLFGLYLFVISGLTFVATGFSLLLLWPLLIAVLLLAFPNLLSYLIASYLVLNGLVTLLAPMVSSTT